MPETDSTSRSERGTRSSRSDGSRSRSRSGRRRHSRRHRSRRHRGYPKVSERNFAGAACSMMAVVGTCSALAKSECFIFKGGSCQNGNGDYLTSLGISNFLFSGHFVNQTAYQYSSFGYQHHLYYCVDGGTVAVLRGILALVILSTLCTLVAFVMDLIGPKQRHMMIVRRNGILNILAVFILITVCGICYWAALLLYDNLHAHKRAKGSKVLVDFGVSYYILVGSAVANIIATACNLLRRYPPMTIETDREPIINDVDNAILGNEPVVPPSLMVREPPPYAP